MGNKCSVSNCDKTSDNSELHEISVDKWNDGRHKEWSIFLCDNHREILREKWIDFKSIAKPKTLATIFFGSSCTMNNECRGKIFYITQDRPLVMSDTYIPIADIRICEKHLIEAKKIVFTVLNNKN